ncbi:hypothetical protein Mrad2831_5666 [Methylobacterium radiotolerans JCM 2831]|uniref:Uncharacterized protein n=2 Tax=Methylobacterium radiotolerans TaxID=31998 RepID=B1M1M8_METRJ|nr:hypothetical protein Mrad2831_5666 [Methylobacterium radiotolerans JCM 2831]GEM95946.1 hypothetical protein MRA01_04860 [Methylobacterium radiotolerans]
MPGPANSNAEPETYDMRPDDEGWTVYAVSTDEPARVNGVRQTGLDMEKADDLVDLLNRLARQKGGDAST